MKIITQRDQIRSVAARWKAQYWADKVWYSPLVGDAEQIYNQLLALDVETAMPEQVNAIIGNESWVRLQCDEQTCRKYTDWVLEVGAESDYTAHLCRECVSRAAKMREEGK